MIIPDELRRAFKIDVDNLIKKTLDRAVEILRDSADIELRAIVTDALVGAPVKPARPNPPPKARRKATRAPKRLGLKLKPSPKVNVTATLSPHATARAVDAIRLVLRKANGPVKAGILRTLPGYSRTSLQGAMSLLLAKKEVTRTMHGEHAVYELTAKGRGK